MERQTALRRVLFLKNAPEGAIEQLTWMLQTQSLHTVRARLASYLLRISGGDTTFLLRETNEEIASHMGSVREVISRTLHSLKDTGAITIQGRQVTLHDPEMLRRIAASDNHSPE